MPAALVLQHIGVEGPGLLGVALRKRGIDLRTVHPYAGEPVPARCDADALIVMGGPMGVYESDRHPHLRDELRLIEATVAGGRPVIGICLGSQLLASALGARVYKNTRKEIGWHEVALSEAASADALLRDAPRRFTPMHWHGDVFDLPAGATNLAASHLTPHQAFRHGANVYGFLFHLELDRAHLDSWMTAFAAELDDVGLPPNDILADADRRLAAAAAVGATVFDRFAALVGA